MELDHKTLNAAVTSWHQTSQHWTSPYSTVSSDVFEVLFYSSVLQRSIAREAAAVLIKRWPTTAGPRTRHFSQRKPDILCVLLCGRAQDCYHPGNNNTRAEEAETDAHCRLHHRVSQSGGVDGHSSACWSAEAHLEPAEAPRAPCHPPTPCRWRRGRGEGPRHFHLTGLVVRVFETVSRGLRGVTLLLSPAVSLLLPPIHHLLDNYRVQLPLRLSCSGEERDPPPARRRLYWQKSAEVISSSATRRQVAELPLFQLLLAESEETSCFYFQSRFASVPLPSHQPLSVHSSGETVGKGRSRSVLAARRPHMKSVTLRPYAGPGGPGFQATVSKRRGHQRLNPRDFSDGRVGGNNGGHHLSVGKIARLSFWQLHKDLIHTRALRFLLPAFPLEVSAGNSGTSVGVWYVSARLRRWPGGWGWAWAPGSYGMESLDSFLQLRCLKYELFHFQVNM